MRSKFKWIFTLLLAFSMQFSFAQEKTITGTVTEGGLPMPGVTVQVKGTKKATATDIDGKYSIQAKQGDVLEFTSVGMQNKTATVGASNSVSVAMTSAENTLDQVQLEGYNKTRTKATTTSAITTISAETLENRPNASFLNSLQGQAPGLSVLSSSGSPGSGKIDLLVRGLSSLNASTDPLIVIDGVPTNSNQFRNLNQNDIETVSVLRDAAATSIYGNRGANGVLLITTKRAKYGQSLRVSYDVTTGMNTLPKNNYNLSNSKQILTLEKRKNTGLGATLSDAEIANYATNTNWLDEFFGTDLFQQHNLSLAFGGENVSNYTSLGYYEQGGLVPTTDFKRFTVRNNLNGKSANGKFTYSSQVALGYSKRNQLNQETNAGVNNNTIQNPLQGALTGLPYGIPNQYATGQELYDAIGTNFSGFNDTYVLEDILHEGSIPSWATETSISANITTSYKITPEFTLGNKAGIDYKENDRVFARSPGSYLAIAVRESNGLQFGGFEDQANSKDFTFTNISSFNFSKTINTDHKIDAGVYVEYMKAHFLSKSFRQTGLNPKTWTPGSGNGYAPIIPATVGPTGNLIPAQNVPTVGATKVDAGTFSYFASVDYDYKEKYGVSGVIRRDASYRFIDDNKWGTFWSASARWNIDKEAFMQGSMFDLLKLRASYGTQGNQNIIAADYGTNPLFLATSLVRDLNDVGSGYDNNSGIFVSNIANTTLQWEEVSQANIGLDFRLLKNRLDGNIDFYRKQTDKLYNQITRSASTSVYSQTANNGSLRNSGVEISLKYDLFKGSDFNMSVFANGSYNKNEIIAILPTDQRGNDNINVVGGPAYQWNLIPYVGVNPVNGNLLFLDKEGNATENPDPVADRRPMDKNYLPVYQGGFGFNADYKGFFADVLFTWTEGAYRYDNQLRWANLTDFIGDENVSKDMLNAWTPENHTNYPSLNATNVSLDQSSDRWLKDSSFLRLKNASFGYNFPQKFLEKTFMSSLKLFVQGENLLTWTKWQGFDPESVTSFYVTGYPNPRTISFGASVQF